MTISAVDIRNFLPHRKPMLMVDRVNELTSDTVKTDFEISDDNIFVEDGAFSEFGLIENAAQTCSTIVARSYFDSDDLENKKKKNVIGFISSIKSIQVLSLPKSGQTIETISTLLSRFSTENYNTCMVNCKTFHESELIMECELNLFIKTDPDEKG